MSDFIAVSAYKAAYILLDKGFAPETVQQALKTIPQPAKGYYAISDITAFKG